MSISTSNQRSLTSGYDPILDDVIEEMANRLQAGEPVDGAAILAKYPDRADSIRRLLPAMEVMAEFGVSASRLAAAGASPGLSPLTGELGTLGDFRILREVGRGGMGIVYEAEQVSLGRRVALKVLPFAGAMDSHQLRRFQTEAQAAAQLHHTNIVPVFWIGCEQGVHYYAMQFIEGRTLADVIRELRQLEGTDCGDCTVGKDQILDNRAASALASKLTQEFPPPATPEDVPPPAAAPGPPVPSAGRTPAPPSGSSTRNRAYFRNVARLGMEAAEALEHAHQEGIVHRDIKPANLMIDARGHLWVTDFGLARLQGDSGLTITGDLLGTLRYMSPEQALGKAAHLDHRTDIYSLGATLYELSTLRPAFDGKDRQEVLARIAQDEPVPPRRLDPAIPRELETILLKAMSKEPEDRYATAQELADDLRRFLEDKPIKARRPTLLERVAKWSRRHPAFLAFGFLLLAVIATGLAIGSTLLARKQIEVSRQRDRANELAGIADAQRDRAEQNARLARRAVDEMFTQVAERWLADQPRLEPVQREFLEKALRFYTEFSSQKEADPAARQSVADAWRRVGEIRLKLGMIRPAEDALRRAVAIDLADASSDDRAAPVSDDEALPVTRGTPSRRGETERSGRGLPPCQGDRADVDRRHLGGTTSPQSPLRSPRRPGLGPFQAGTSFGGRACPGRGRCHPGEARPGGPAGPRAQIDSGEQPQQPRHRPRPGRLDRPRPGRPDGEREGRLSPRGGFAAGPHRPGARIEGSSGRTRHVDLEPGHVLLQAEGIR